MSIAREPFAVTTPDGWTLRGEWLLPSTPRSVAVAGHGMMVDRRTLDRPRGDGLVTHLARAGVAVLWIDLRGHGESGPRAEEGGDWGYDDLVADVPVLLEAARARFPSLPLYTVGHSLFAHVVLGHLSRRPGTALDGHVMLAANVCNPGWRARPLLLLSRGLGIEAMALLARVRGRVPIRALKQGTDDEALGYARDFVRIWRRQRWRARDGYDYWDALPSVSVPTLALVGAGDKYFAPPVDAREVAARLPRCDFEVVGRRSGLAFDPGHMGLVLDERCRPVWERVAAFVNATSR
jgi:predicted alpha/beta hydrolase